MNNVPYGIPNPVIAPYQGIPQNAYQYDYFGQQPISNYGSNIEERFNNIEKRLNNIEKKLNFNSNEYNNNMHMI